MRPSQHHTRAAARAALRSAYLVPLAVAGVALVLDRTRAQDSRDRAPAAHAPAIARIAGVNVGVDTLKALKARFGDGAPMAGARGCVWAWPAAHCVIRATFAPPTGLPRNVPPPPLLESDVIRTVSLECAADRRRQGAADCPTVHGYVRDLGWLGAATPGMTRDKLIEAAKKLPPCEEHGAEMIWRSSTQPPPATRGVSATRWAAVVRFSEGKVVSIRVAAQ